MALEMDLAFYFHQGRHDFSTMHGEIWPQVRSTVFHWGRLGSPARTLLNCYSSRIVRRDLCRCLSSGLTDSFTCAVVVSHVNLPCTIRDVREISWKVSF